MIRPVETESGGSYYASLLNYFRARVTGSVSHLPVLVLMPHSRCNCKCVMCDIWKANKNALELTPEMLAPHVEAMRKLGVQSILLSGGEPLMHSNLWTFLALLKPLDARIMLLSTGLLLKENARQICETCDEVIVSLDGSPQIHNEIRRVPLAFEKLQEGVQALKAAVQAIDAKLSVTARCVIQRQNYLDLTNIVRTARTLDLDRISFLTADVSSTAFNRPEPWDETRQSEVALDRKQAEEFSGLIEELIETNAADIRSGFIAESPEKLRRLASYYLALNGVSEFIAPPCNAPWVSAVIEADGTVRPCFFHKAFGNIHQQSLLSILNGREAVEFRKNLNVERDPVCRKCVCSLHL